MVRIGHLNLSVPLQMDDKPPRPLKNLRRRALNSDEPVSGNASAADPEDGGLSAFDPEAQKQP